MGDYGAQHERANVITHFVGFIFGLVALPLLLFTVYQADFTTQGDMIGTVVYGLSFLMVFGFSTLYHQARRPERRGLMKVWDHISIYYLIAGTYTPLLLAFANRDDAAKMLYILWGLAAAGTLFKIFFTGKFRLVSTAIYLAMGWMVLLAPASFKEALPDEQMWWIAFGGISYSLGVVFYLVKSIPFHHAVWHVFVLVGAVSHYFGIWKVFV